jgi:hypothetical protein
MKLYHDLAVSLHGALDELNPTLSSTAGRGLMWRLCKASSGTPPLTLTSYFISSHHTLQSSSMFSLLNLRISLKKYYYKEWLP